MKIDLLRYCGILPVLYISLAIIVSFSMPKSSRALIISMTIPSGHLALFPFTLDTAARISDCRIFGPSMFFRISGLPPLLSRNSSSMYSVHLSRRSSFSVIMVPSFERMQPLDEHVFAPVKSYILLCVAFVSVSFLFYISAHSLFNHSSFASLHFFLISRCNCFYSSLVPLWYSLPSAHHSEYFLCHPFIFGLFRFLWNGFFCCFYKSFSKHFPCRVVAFLL